MFSRSFTCVAWRLEGSWREGDVVALDDLRAASQIAFWEVCSRLSSKIYLPDGFTVAAWGSPASFRRSPGLSSARLPG
ncbi:MAG: hypothetical protein AVDCRST_MAG80-2071 [uncultured Rubrobacteraceae bacterium]|uniref:Uncharacterized protein n=1 Tax=uncultured Rubrobacteraceae bacterium TaxID=349277 RepID=A0A6J4QQN3_9ACTN|nr:MAG: hypothetical protein AVDCRST_MAG80-2071 [uncultured Rubrobacteraceae bacterium]